MTLVRWDPFRELEDMSDRLNRMFSRPALPRTNGKETMVVADWVPSVDVSETDGGYQIKAEIPDVKKEDVPGLLAALDKFDEVFAVIHDDDIPKMKQVLQWAQAEGREKDISQELNDAIQSAQLSDSDIETRIGEMKAARTARDFKKSDAIRAELAEAGILVEITKDGIRWRRK